LTAPFELIDYRRMARKKSALRTPQLQRKKKKEYNFGGIAPKGERVKHQPLAGPSTINFWAY
jgi:hypothetical protein